MNKCYYEDDYNKKSFLEEAVKVLRGKGPIQKWINADPNVPSWKHSPVPTRRRVVKQMVGRSVLDAPVNTLKREIDNAKKSIMDLTKIKDVKNVDKWLGSSTGQKSKNRNDVKLLKTKIDKNTEEIRKFNIGKPTKKSSDSPKVYNQKSEGIFKTIVNREKSKLAEKPIRTGVKIALVTGVGAGLTIDPITRKLTGYKVNPDTGETIGYNPNISGKIYQGVGKTGAHIAREVMKGFTSVGKGGLDTAIEAANNKKDDFLNSISSGVKKFAKSAAGVGLGVGGVLGGTALAAKLIKDIYKKSEWKKLGCEQTKNPINRRKCKEYLLNKKIDELNNKMVYDCLDDSCKNRITEEIKKLVAEREQLTSEF